MGESKLKRSRAEDTLLSCAGVQTPSGKFQVRWGSSSAATPMGQLAYFIEFLGLTGLWSSWTETCPLTYASPNAPSKADVLGTWMLSVLSGHKRYSHVTAIRCDGVNPGLLGMNKVISEYALRRALVAIPEAEGVAWLDRHLSESVVPLLDTPWILDIDTTVKPLYGKQEGAVVSYNPKKPGRPSHSYHTYLMAGLRLVLGVEVKAGNKHTGSHSLPGLLHVLDDLGLGQLYRDRADCENTFDELKNQWGWGGFTTHDLHRCQLSARAVALIYNWWSLFVRLASPETRREAITSRPWLMSSVGRRTEHAGQTTLTLTGLHAHFDKARQVLMQVSARLQAWAKEIAEQLRVGTVWRCVCDHLKLTVAGIGPPKTLLLGDKSPANCGF
jgi:hypothetical protein